MAEKLNITHHYDDLADVLYIDFGSDEPCFTENLDGLAMIDIGWFTKLPCGIRIMSAKERRVKNVSFQMVVGRLEKVCKGLMQRQARRIEQTESVLQSNLVQELNQAFAGIQ